MFKKLIKWTAIGAVTLGAIGFFLFGDHVGSYVSTAVHSVREGVTDNVPVEFQLKRADSLIKEIEPQIRNCQREVAQAEVALERVLEDVDALEIRVAKDRGKLKDGVALLSGNGEVQYALAGGNNLRRRVEIDMKRTLETLKVNENLLSSKKALIAQQTRAVEMARAKLEAVRTQKAQLEDSIAMLKAQKAQLDVMAASSRRFDLDDTALSKAKEVLDQVRNHLDVTQKVLEQDLLFAAGGDEPAVPPTANVVQEITDYLADSADSADSRGRSGGIATSAVAGARAQGSACEVRAGEVPHR